MCTETIQTAQGAPEGKARNDPLEETEYAICTPQGWETALSPLLRFLMKLFNEK
jgi:hypothetical protein